MKGKLLLDCGEGKALGIVATVCLLRATELLDAELAEREAFQDGSGRDDKDPNALVFFFVPPPTPSSWPSVV